MRSLVLVPLCAYLLSAKLLLMSLISIFTLNTKEEQLVAADDRFIMVVDCNNNVLTGNLLTNDTSDSNANMEIAYVVAPKVGLFSCGPNGNFIYILDAPFNGIVEFRYRIRNTEDKTIYSDACVIITVQNDNDCDHVPDDYDIDLDNDGILNIYEGDCEIDTDNDGIPDCYDIDSDNDGITDLVEWQEEDEMIWPKLEDVNNDGWDDAFDTEYGGNFYPAIDTDGDGIPDFQDSDSDNDMISDLIESTNCTTELVLSEQDDDNDGLDNIFDTLSCCYYQKLTVTSTSDLPDTDHDQIRDWRDDNNRFDPNSQFESSDPFAGKPYVYPNPVTESCQVILTEATSEETNFEVSVISQNGSYLLQQNVQSTGFVLSLGDLPAGTYILQVASERTIYTTSIVKL